MPPSGYRNQAGNFPNGFLERRTNRQELRRPDAISSTHTSADYCTAIVTMLELTPPMLRLIGTASPEGALAGIWTST